MILFVHTQWITRSFVVLVMALLGACSLSPDQALVVRQFHLRDTEPDSKKAPMVRGEQVYRLKGAVTLEQREERLGDYYTVTWRALGAEPTRLVMDFQQSSSGAKVHCMSRDLPTKVSGGKVEFKVTGDTYRVGGRVLAWRIRLMQGSEVLSEKRSYLWR